MTIQAGRTTFVVLVLEKSSSLGRTFQRILAWFAIPAVLWVAGGLLQGEARYLLCVWAVGATLDPRGPATLGGGRVRTDA